MPSAVENICWFDVLLSVCEPSTYLMLKIVSTTQLWALWLFSPFNSTWLDLRSKCLPTKTHTCPWGWRYTVRVLTRPACTLQTSCCAECSSSHGQVALADYCSQPAHGREFRGIMRRATQLPRLRPRGPGESPDGLRRFRPGGVRFLLSMDKSSAA